MSTGERERGLHNDAELDRPELLTDERAFEIAAQCLRKWDAFPTIPGTLRWRNNGMTALRELSFRVDRLREERDEARGKIAAEMARAEREADTLYAEGHAYASGKVDAYEFALAALAAASVPGQEGAE